MFLHPEKMGCYRGELMARSPNSLARNTAWWCVIFAKNDHQTSPGTSAGFDEDRNYNDGSRIEIRLLEPFCVARSHVGDTQRGHDTKDSGRPGHTGDDHTTYRGIAASADGSRE